MKLTSEYTREELDIVLTYVRADIREDVKKFFNEEWPSIREIEGKYLTNHLECKILEIVDKHFEKLEGN